MDEQLEGFFGFGIDFWFAVCFAALDTGAVCLFSSFDFWLYAFRSELDTLRSCGLG
jgi:hypothetical protein